LRGPDQEGIKINAKAYFFLINCVGGCFGAAKYALWEERYSARVKSEVAPFRRSGKGSLKKGILEVGGRWVKS
jgi:hypothetical protein